MILGAFGDLHWPAVVTATGIAFLVGLAWFSPRGFGGIWAREVSRYSYIPAQEISAAAEKPLVLAKWFAVIAINAVVMALAANVAGADSAGAGTVLGLVLGVGFGATFFAWPPLFAGMPWRWWLLNSGAFLVMLATMGAVLGGWR